MILRIGIGYDIHPRVEGRKLYIGGVDIPSNKGSLGLSDGDVLIHAFCDALLGALGLGNIGELLPDTDELDFPLFDYLITKFIADEVHSYESKRATKTAEIRVRVKSVFPSPDKEAQKTTITSLGEGGKTFST